MQALEPGVHGEADLLEIATRLACEGYWQDIKQVMVVSRVFRSDEQLWDAMKDETGSKKVKRSLKGGYLNPYAFIHPDERKKGGGERTRLMHAAWTYNPERLHFLLERGAKVNLTSEDGLSALQFATLQGSFHESRPSITNLHRPNDEQVDVVLELCRRGACVARPLDSFTPLMWAASNGLPKVVHELCKIGVDVNATTKSGASALVWVVFSVIERQRKLVQERGRKKDDGSQERDFGIEKGRALETIKILCKMGANGREDCMGVPMTGTALLLACEARFVDVARALIDGGVSVNASRSLDGLNPLMMACELNDVELAQILCSKGVNLETLNMEGNSPLMRASELGREQIVKLLILKGANVNAIRTSDGATSLMLATMQQHRGIVLALKEAGASSLPMTIGEFEGKTSDDFAAASALLNHFKDKIKAEIKPKASSSQHAFGGYDSLDEELGF